MPERTNYAATYRVRAKELREKALFTRDKNFREVALKCASDYEKLANEFDREALIARLEENSN